MHANTEAVGRYKTRRYDNIRAEVRSPRCAAGRAARACSGLPVAGI